MSFSSLISSISTFFHLNFMDMISKNFQQDAMYGDEMIRHFFFSAPEAIHIFFSPVHSSSRIHSCVLYVLYIYDKRLTYIEHRHLSVYMCVREFMRWNLVIFMGILCHKVNFLDSYRFRSFAFIQNGGLFRGVNRFPCFLTFISLIFD